MDPGGGGDPHLQRPVVAGLAVTLGDVVGARYLFVGAPTDAAGRPHHPLFWGGPCRPALSPNNFQVGNDGVAWIGDNGNLMLFHKGTTYTASYENVNDYTYTGNVLKYEVGNNTTTIFYNGKNQ